MTESLYDDANDKYGDDDRFSQFGEEPVIRLIFDLIGIQSKTCVEFGAGDGVSCSNTARLWRDEGWKAVLLEADAQRFDALEANARLFDTARVHALVAPTGPNSISEILVSHGFDQRVDLVSIDIDGDDYFVLEGLTCGPRVIVIEFNPTIPPHVELRQGALGESFGASLLAIVRLGARLGYQFVGATRCNAFLVAASEAGPFAEYETNIDVLFPREQYTYAVTDFYGRVVLCGNSLPWHPKDPYVLPLEATTNVMPVTNSAQHLRRGFESLWGPAWWLTPDGLSRDRLRSLLEVTQPPLVCIDLTSATSGTAEWMRGEAELNKYRVVAAGQVLGLIKES